MEIRKMEEIFECLSAYSTSAALGAALELGLFWLLDEKPLDAEEISKRLDIPENRCRYWLEIIRQLGLIELTPAGFAPSDLAHATILNIYSRDTWTFLAQEEMERLPLVCNLAQNLHRRDVSSAYLEMMPMAYVEKLRKDPDRARRFTRMLFEVHQPLAAKLADLLDFSAVRRMLDLGGGSGVISLAFLKKYPQLAATVIDLENVCKASREMIAESSLNDTIKERIEFLPADFLHEALPSGYDLAMMCDVGIFNENLFKNIRQALNSNGHLVIVHSFASPGTLINPRRLLWTFQDLLSEPELEIMTLDRLQSLLSRSGFHISPEAEARHVDRLLIIQAVKGSD